jgi:hypothetical protein
MRAPWSRSPRTSKRTARVVVERGGCLSGARPAVVPGWGHAAPGCFPVGHGERHPRVARPGQQPGQRGTARGGRTHAAGGQAGGRAVAPWGRGSVGARGGDRLRRGGDGAGGRAAGCRTTLEGGHRGGHGIRDAAAAALFLPPHGHGPPHGRRGTYHGRRQRADRGAAPRRGAAVVSIGGATVRRVGGREVTFHPTEGYPVQLAVDPIPMAADDEVDWRSRDVRRVSVP